MESAVNEEPGNKNKKITLTNPITPLPVGRDALSKDGKHRDPPKCVTILIALQTLIFLKTAVR